MVTGGGGSVDVVLLVSKEKSIELVGKGGMKLTATEKGVVTSERSIEAGLVEEIGFTSEEGAEGKEEKSIKLGFTVLRKSKELGEAEGTEETPAVEEEVAANREL